MKVAVISDSPAMTTGFGIVTNQCCDALLAAGHTVVCFGFKHDQPFVSGDNELLTIEPIDPREQWQIKLKAFLSRHLPDVIWINMDVFNLQEVIKAMDGVSLPPMSLYAIFDGLPVYHSVLSVLSSFKTIVVTTNVARSYLEREGYRVHAVAPPGVDSVAFRSLDKPSLRREAGLDGSFLVGSFGRNCERKQQHKLLLALEMLSRVDSTHNVLLYLHCSRRGYWDLEDLAFRLGLSDRILYASEDFVETQGVPLERIDVQAPSDTPRIPVDFGYVERLNLCDFVLNVPHSGDFEQVLIEAPACGIAVAGTDDDGIMRSALGPNIALPVSHKGMGNVGQELTYVSVESVTTAILEARANPQQLGRLASVGRSYALLHTWERMRLTLLSAIQTAAGGLP